jgi:hypothetical protein
MLRGEIMALYWKNNTEHLKCVVWMKYIAVRLNLVIHLVTTFLSVIKLVFDILVSK